MVFIEKGLDPYEHIPMPILENEMDLDDPDFFLEDGEEDVSKLAETYFIADRLYPKVEEVLSTNIGRSKFKDISAKFIDRNSEKLHTAGPMYMIAFTDRDKANYYSLFNTNEKEIDEITMEVRKSLGIKSEFRYIKQNPCLFLLYCCLRYFTIHKDNEGAKIALAMYALAVYPSIFHKYYKYGVSNPGAMEYTMDNLTNKFNFKRAGNLLNTLVMSITNSFKSLHESIIIGSDKECLRWVQRIRSDQNSMMKKVRDQYEKNRLAGNQINSSLEMNSEGELIDTYTNNTSEVELVTRKVALPAIMNGVNLKYAQAAGNIGHVSVVDMRFYLSQILVNENADSVTNFIQAILFIWLYDEHHTKAEINGSAFLIWAGKLFQRTNSNDPNIVLIKSTLQQWSDMVGITQKFTREATRINYKKALFFYFIFIIQYYNH